MNTAVARLPNTAPGIWSPKQLELIKRTVAKDLDRDSKGNLLHLGEFDLFMETCNGLRLDPVRRQIFGLVFNKDKPKKRQMAIVVSIIGYRTIADRTKCYRPGNSQIFYDESLRNDSNPLGLSHARVSVWKYAQNEWHEFYEEAYWEECCPTRWSKMQKVATGDTYDDGNPIYAFQPASDAKLIIDPSKEGWVKMGRVMISKCAEARALRRGWPDDFAGTYAEGEMDRAEVLDLTATEMAEQAAAENRLALVGGADAMIVQWDPNVELARVPVGKFVDEALKWAHDKTRKGVEITDWQVRNRVTLQEFWARHKGDALALRDALGERLTQLAETEAKKATTDETPQAQAIKADERAGQGCHG